MIASRGAVWEHFPVTASPRPVVLIGSRAQVFGGFVDGQAKMAAVTGAMEADVPLPHGVLELVRGKGKGPEVDPIRIMAIESTTAAFLCDRGPRDLPAYRVTLSGLSGHMTVLDPNVDCWWPAPGEEPSPHLAEARIESDDRTIHFPALGGVLTEFIGAEFIEHRAYVIGRAITEERPSSDPTVLVGLERSVVGRLAAPLGGRVLTHTDGHPLAVTAAE